MPEGYDSCQSDWSGWVWVVFKALIAGGLDKEAMSRHVVMARPVLQVDEKEQNAPSQEVTVNLSAFIRKKSCLTQEL